MLRIERTESHHPDFEALASRLSQFLSVLNGDADDFYAAKNRVDGLPTVVVAYYNEAPVGCGAIREIDDHCVEIKRMFVDPAVRNHGIGKAILKELETWATELGFTSAVLETSRRLEPAISLYSRTGYFTIPNYGAYVDVADSVCMQKALAPAS